MVSEAIIRRVLELNDAMGINILTEDVVHSTFRRMGYQGDFRRSMVKKSNVSYQWRFLLHGLGEPRCRVPRKLPFYTRNSQFALFCCMVFRELFGFGSGLLVDAF